MWGNAGSADIPIIIDDGTTNIIHGWLNLELDAYPVNLFIDHEMKITNMTEAEMNEDAINAEIQSMLDNIPPQTTCEDPIASNYNQTGECDYANVFTSYEEDIEPIFTDNCTSCHGSSGGLSLESFADLMEGNVISNGDGENSTLYQRMISVDNPMPPSGLIDSYLAERIKAWIDQGALECAQGEDCAGICGGDSVIDECGTCDNDNSNDCIQDCAGTWGGTAEVDNCGVCSGGETGLDVNASCTDCNGDVNGEAVIDGCGDCVAGNTGLIACIKDCAGVDGGDAAWNECGTCICNSSTPTEGYDCVTTEECIAGCDGFWYNDGNAPILDECEVCDGDNSTCTDCAGTPNGTAWIDECGQCVPEGDMTCLSLNTVVMPTELSIESIYPNPFNPTVNIEFYNPNVSTVNISIVDLNGKIVATIHNNILPIGYHQMNWKANNRSSGIYLLVIQSENTVLTERLILLK